MDEKPNEIRRFINLIDILYEKNTRVLFDAALPPFRLFGTSLTVSEFENFRQKLLNKFNTLQNALDLAGPFCVEKGYLNREGFEKAFHEIADVPPRTSLHIFETLSRSNGVSLVSLNAIRASLFFHSMNYDQPNAPKAIDPFLFGQQDTAQPEKTFDHRSISLEYQLYNNAGSSSTEDNKFAYVRSVSRIREMISLPYLTKHQEMHQLNDMHLLGVGTQN